MALLSAPETDNVIAFLMRTNLQAGRRVLPGTQPGQQAHCEEGQQEKPDVHERHELEIRGSVHRTRAHEAVDSCCQVRTMQPVHIHGTYARAHQNLLPRFH